MTQTALLQTDQLRDAANASEPAQFREAPHNIEAEQALLGAILINNEAMDRVSAFLEPLHFFDPLHGQIYEVAGKMIQAGKQATPITLKTFFENAEPIDAHLTVPQYLGRLATSATTIINAEDYGRTIYDLAVRRNLIVLGEDMVNSAYDAPIDFPPESQIQEAETRLYDLAERGKYGQGFMSFGNALTHAIDMAAAAYERDGHLSGLSPGLNDLDNRMGGLQASDLNLVTAVLVYFTAHLFESRYKLLLWLDALGLAAYCVLGAWKALEATGSPVIAVVMGVITASFGGILRDQLAGEPCILLRPEIYITAALAGAATYTGLHLAGLPVMMAAFPAALVAFAIPALQGAAAMAATVR